ncbi:MAG: hypothetical protein QOI07_909 [Verrucomicrobiota bacterium]|jgi:hypothetical protein
MDVTNAAFIISLAALLLTLGGLVYIYGWKMAELNAVIRRLKEIDKALEHLPRMRVEHELIWDALLKRGAAEGLNKGLFTLNSPLKITPEARAMLSGLQPKLVALYHELGPDISEQQLGKEIERRYAPEIVKDVCVPNGINLMSCILIAIGVARGTDTLDTVLDHIDLILTRTSGEITL